MQVSPSPSNRREKLYWTISVEHNCTASIGVVLFSGETATQEEIFMHADAAMYQAKAAGRNRVRFHAAQDC